MFFKLALIFILMHDKICLAGRKSAIGLLHNGGKSAMGFVDDFLKQATLARCVPRGGRGPNKKRILKMLGVEESPHKEACQNFGNGGLKEMKGDFDVCLWERLSVACQF